MMLAINFKNNDGLFNIATMLFANYNDKDGFLICNVIIDLVDWSNFSKGDTSNTDMMWQQNALLLLRDELCPASLHLILD